MTHIALEAVEAVLVDGEWIEVGHDARIATVTIDTPSTSGRTPLVEGPAAGGPYLSFASGEVGYAFPLSKISGWRYSS